MVLISSVGRLLSEVLDPVITRSIAILARRGKLPPMPDEMRGEPEYEIEHVSMLAMAQKQTEMASLNTALGMAGSIAQFKPEVLDKIDGDKAIDHAWAITGAPVNVLRDDEEVAKIREMRGQEEAQLAQNMQVQQGLETAKVASEAARNMAEANRE